MLRRLLIAVLSGAISTASAQAPGDRLAELPLRELAQTEARTFDDLIGQAVLLEFFAHWCGPCGLQVGHLNELHDRYARRGLAIVAVTSSEEDRRKTEEWIRTRGVRYAWAWDPKARTSSWFGVTGIPHGVLLDPDGTIVWRGHPSQLRDETIEQVLARSVSEPFWRWTGPRAPVRDALEANDYGRAIAAARALESSDGHVLVEALRARIVRRMDSIHAAREAENFLQVEALARVAASDFRGLPEGDEAASLLRALEGDRDAQRIMSGQRAFAAIEFQARSVQARSYARSLILKLQELSTRHQGTVVAKDADLLARRLQKKLSSLD
jgi:peroxiredoxin